MRISDWSSDVCSSDLENAADLVAVVRPYHETDWSCGVAWMNAGGRLPQAISDAYGFSVSNVAPSGPDVLAHEIGLNLGTAHDREPTSATGPLHQGGEKYCFRISRGGPPDYPQATA